MKIFVWNYLETGKWKNVLRWITDWMTEFKKNPDTIYSLRCGQKSQYGKVAS